MLQTAEPAPDSKWVPGVAGKYSVKKAAYLVLKTRFRAVSYWLPLAAEKSDEDVEYVHQLRVSARRATEAVRAFSDLIPNSKHEDLRGKLRRIRRAAGDARNLDVLCVDLARCAENCCEETCKQVAETTRRRRAEAQQPIVAIHEEFAAGDFSGQVADVLGGVKRNGKANAERPFRKHAPRYLERVLKRFFRASEADLEDDEALHEFRLCGKRLRYTMEIVAPAFAPSFRKKLYPRISMLQDIMGAVNDHATAKVFFSDWIDKTDDAQVKAFFRGLVLAETRAHDDLRQAFRFVWIPRLARELKRQFRSCCGVT